MAIKLNCLEPLTAIGIGIGACALAPIDAGLTAGAVIGGAGLFSRIKENAQKAGLDDDQLIADFQKRVLRDWDHWEDTQEMRDAVTLADGAMTRLLPLVMLKREELAQTATDSASEPYPAMAARKIVKRMARHEPMFADGQDGTENLPRKFALEVIERALQAAKDDQGYAILLTLDIAIELGRAQAETIQALSELTEKVERGFASVQAEIAAIKADPARDGGELAKLSEQALRGAISNFVLFSPGASTSAIVDAVNSFAVDYAELREKVKKLDAHDNRLRGLQQDAELALEQSDLDRARRLLREAADLKFDAVSQAARDAAQTIAGLAEADLLAFDWESAAATWHRAAQILAPFDAETSAKILVFGGDHLRRFGEKFYGGSLDAAVKTYRAALEVLTQDEFPDDWAATQHNLGLALKVQGELLGGEVGIVLLGEAVDAYHAALEVHTVDGSPVVWAAAKVNIGIALTTLGRLYGGEPGVALLNKAVDAFHAVLEVRSREEFPIKWASTKNNLGLALQAQGELLGGEVGFVLFGEAVDAYRAALEVHTVDGSPVVWAAMQNNLANALQAQGQLRDGEVGIALLNEAVGAYRAALKGSPRDESPVQWALIQSNLGSVFSTLGELLTGGKGNALLEKAVDAYRAALEVRTRDASPVGWANTQNNLGTTLSTQGELLGGEVGIVLLGEAVDAYNAALEVHTVDGSPVVSAMIQKNRGMALTTIGRLSVGEEIAAYLDAKRTHPR